MAIGVGRRTRRTTRGRQVAGTKRLFLAILACAFVGATPSAHASVDYLADDFTLTRVLDWGDRPTWSPDGKKLAFLENEDPGSHAYELDLRTGSTRCLTCEMGDGMIMRVHYLADGSYLLSVAVDPIVTQLGMPGRFLHEMAWMPSDASQPPQPVGQGAFEGLVLSRESLRVGWTVAPPNDPSSLGLQIWTGRIEHDGTTAKLVDRQLVGQQPDPGGTLVPVIEAQDFFPGDQRILFHGVPASGPPEFAGSWAVFELDIATGAVTRHSYSPWFDEAEGLSPDGNVDFIETTRYADPEATFRGAGVAVAAAGLGGLDLAALRLDGTGENVRRITHFGDDHGKAHNPTVSPDGRRVAFGVEGPQAGLWLAEFACRPAMPPAPQAPRC